MRMYPKTFSGLPAVQLDAEFSPFIELVVDESITSYLEIGTARGDTFHEIVTHMPKGSKAVAVDYPEKSWGLNGSQNQLREVSKDLKKQGYDINIIWGNSQHNGVVENVTKHAPFDMVFIDGDHTYEGVKSDWENYGKLGRIVVFHDIADPGKANKRREVIEVKRFWDELKVNHKYVEFIDKTAKFPMGIGVLWND